MAFKNRLLATAAIPLMALTWMSPVAAAELLRPAAPAEVQSLVVKVQADDDEELLKQKRQERREKRRQQADDADQTQQTDQEQVKPRHKKQHAADDQQMQQDNSGQLQQTDQEQVKPRRKKQQAADDQQMQMQDDSGQMQQTDQEQVKPRRKKQQDNAASDQNQSDDGQLKNAIDKNNKKHRKQQAADEEQMQQDNADQAQQSDEEQVKPRRKKQQDNAASDQNQSDDDQLKNAIDKNNKKKHKQNAADEEQMQQDNANQAQQGDEEQVKPRRKKQQDNAASDENQSTDDKLKNAIDKNKHKKNQDQAEQPADDNGEADQANRKNRERPVDVKKAKDIAEDPSKTTDTVVLPVENGAAVLDSDKDADKGGTDRDRRKREREEVKSKPAPKSDKDAQIGFKDDEEIRIKPVLELKGERIPGFKGYDDFGGRRVDDRDNRVIINIGGKIVIRSDDDRRIARNTDIRYERLQNNLVREVVIQPNGDKIITVRNRYGEIVRRSRIERDNREVVIFYSPELQRGRDRLFLRDPGADLPPMRLRIPVDDYIIDVSGNGGRRNYEQFLEEPPVERVERVYSVDEVKNSARIRDKMRRIDLDTITFETGSSDIAEDQVQSLKQVGQAIKNILDKDPGETFLIEGHTDAVGSDESNLVLSDQRSESVANVLSEAFDIPAENLVTQGYGERYLKIDSDGPERENRRVTIRRITPLVRPLEAAEQ